jgi:hypothetical protein
MSVRLPTVDVNSVPLPQFTPRSRREDPTRDTANARHMENWQSSVPIQQAFFRPQPAGSDFGYSVGPKPKNGLNDQMGMSTRNKPPISLPAPQFDPAGPKLVGNPFFDQHAPEFDPRKVARELNGAVKEDKMDRGITESQRIMGRGFSSRYVPQGFAEANQYDSLQAFELLRPKIDDGKTDYRNLGQN